MCAPETRPYSIYQGDSRRRFRQTERRSNPWPRSSYADRGADELVPPITQKKDRSGSHLSPVGDDQRPGAERVGAPAFPFCVIVTNSVTGPTELRGGTSGTQPPRDGRCAGTQRAGPTFLPGRMKASPHPSCPTPGGHIVARPPLGGTRLQRGNQREVKRETNRRIT